MSIKVLEAACYTALSRRWGGWSEVYLPSLRIFDVVWEVLVIILLLSYSGRGQECCYTSYKAPDSVHTQHYLAPNVNRLRFRNSAIGEITQICNLVDLWSIHDHSTSPL